MREGFPRAVVADGRASYRFPDEGPVCGINNEDGITFIIVGAG